MVKKEIKHTEYPDKKKNGELKLINILDGITTIDDAVEACRQTKLKGWQLVAYAQKPVARKFTYSRLNPWDSPSRAFERGTGYCQQQTLALKKIYDKLGIKSRPVYAWCKFPSKTVDGIVEPERISRHTWLQVTIGDKTLDVCPGSEDNTPGNLHFEILSDVRILHPLMQPFTHLGSVIENIRRYHQARKKYRQK